MQSIFKENSPDKPYEDQLSEVLDALYNFALKLTQNREEAQDLTQETSLRGFNHYHQYVQHTNFKAWMFTIMRNIFINEYHKKNRQPKQVNFEELEEFITAPAITEREEQLFSESLEYLMSQLPEEMRSVLNLFYLEKFSYKEMAEILNCPVGTVMSRLFMAKQYLKKKLLHLSQKEFSNDQL